MRFYTSRKSGLLHFANGCDGATTITNVPKHIAALSKTCIKCNPDYAEPVFHGWILIELLVEIERLHNTRPDINGDLSSDMFYWNRKTIWGLLDAYSFEWAYKQYIQK